MEKTTCTASSKRITNTLGTAKFPCPGCDDYEIVRTKKMREIAAKYTCPKCGFTGPN